MSTKPPEDCDTDTERALRATLEDLTLDIGRILHANTSTLLMVNQTMIAVIETLSRDHETLEGFLKTGVHTDQEAEVKALADKLARALARLIEAGDPGRREAALPAARWEALRHVAALFEDYENLVPVPEMRHPVIRKSAHQVSEACRMLVPGHLPKEAVRDVARLADQLERTTCLIDALTTRTAVIQMDTSLRALRDFITADLRTADEPELLDMAGVVREVIAQLAEFARASRVEVRLAVDTEEATVFGDRREISRAIANLLHNAIKYSWHRDRSTAPWAGVRIAREGARLLVEFETWGVPITTEEIVEGHIFQIGYRGKWSTDRGRLGTGIGLTDAQQVARSQGGEVLVDSRPAQPSAVAENHPDYYRQPFLTRVTLVLLDNGPKGDRT